MISLFKLLLEVEKIDTIPSGRWVDFDLTTLSDDGMKRLWQMYISTYLNSGMDLSANSWQELQTKYSATALKDVDSDNEPDAFIVYKNTPFGKNSDMTSAINTVDAGVVSLGFRTTVFPAAIAGAHFHTAIIIG